MAFDHVTQIYNTRFGVVITQGAFADLIVCLTEFSKNSRFQKKSLQAIETLKSTVTKMLRTPECPLSHKGGAPAPNFQEEGTNLAKQLTRQSQEEQFWYPILIAFQDVLMTGDDLEVRSRYAFLPIGSKPLLTPRPVPSLTSLKLLSATAVLTRGTSGMSSGGNCSARSLWFCSPSRKCPRFPTTRIFRSGCRQL